MPKIEELEQKLNELKANFNAEFYVLQNELAELKESKKEGKWKPKYGDTYWLRDTIGKFGVSEYCAGDCIEWRLNNIPLFKTREECERYWHFMDTVKEKSYEFSKEKWEDKDINKYSIYYHFQDKEWRIDYDWSACSLGKIYFKTEEDAQYIIDNFKDELMEYWI